MDGRSTEIESNKPADAPASSSAAASGKLFEEYWTSDAVAAMDRLKLSPFQIPQEPSALDSSTPVYPWQDAHRDQSAQELKALQKMLESTHNEISDLRRSLNSTADDTEMARRTLLSNPGKMMTASSGLAVLSKAPGLATMPLVGLAGLQGYDDFRNMVEAKSNYGSCKYALGLTADTALAAGSLGFLLEKVPAKYKSPLLLGGLLGRMALDLIPCAPGEKP